MFSTYDAEENLKGDHERAEVKDAARIVRVAAALAACGLVIVFAARVALDGSEFLPLFGMAVVFSLIVLLINARGYVTAAATALILLLVTLGTYLTVMSEGTHDAAILMYPGVLVLASLTLPRRLYVAIAGLIVIIPVVVGYLETRGVIVNALSSHTDFVSVMDITVILLITAAAVELMTTKVTSSTTRARASETRFRQLFNNSTESVFVMGAVGEDGMPARIVEVNDIACRVLGFSREELLRKAPVDLMEEEVRGRFGFTIAGLGADGSATCECAFTTSGGAAIPMEVSVRAFELEGKRTLIANARDITERRRSEDLLKSALREKEVLLREIHHRVKNNMQVITSLLNLQASQTEDPAARAMLEESRQRVRSIALIHEKLYRTASLADVDFAAYLKSVADELLRTFGKPEITCVLDLEPIRLEIGRAIPAGLIVNELLTNSLRHAFPPGTKGTTRVRLHAAKGGDVELGVEDDGVGFPRGKDLASANTIGLAIVRTLVEQMQGTLTQEAGRGTNITIRFRLEEKEYPGGAAQG